MLTLQQRDRGRLAEARQRAYDFNAKIELKSYVRGLEQDIARITNENRGLRDENEQLKKVIAGPAAKQIKDHVSEAIARKIADHFAENLGNFNKDIKQHIAKELVTRSRDVVFPLAVREALHNVLDRMNTDTIIPPMSGRISEKTAQFRVITYWKPDTFAYEMRVPVEDN